MKILFIAMILAGFNLHGTAMAQDVDSWRGIVPYKSTRYDVEKVLGTCSDDEGLKDRCLYKLQDENLIVSYAVGQPCSETNKRNLPENTVLRIDINLTKGVTSLKNSNFELSKFSVEEDTEIPGHVAYRKIGGGLVLAVFRGSLQNIYYSATDTDVKKAACQ